MTQEEFKKVLNEKGYSYKEEGNKMVVNHWGSVNLGSLTSLPEGIVFSNDGYVDLESLTTLPEGTVFSNDGSVNLNSLTTLPEGIVFSNGGNIHLGSLTSLTEGISFSNSRSVYLGSLIGGRWFDEWKGNIEGIGSKRLLNKMISIGLFNRNKA